MVLLFIVLTATLASAELVVEGYYNKGKTNAFSLVFFIAVFVALFFFFTSGFTFDFTPSTFLYGALYGTCYIGGYLFLILAIKEGGVALSGLIISFSLIFPIFFSIIAYSEIPTALYWIGCGLLILSLTCVGLPRKKPTEQGISISWKWALFIFVALVSNGGCGIIQTAFQRATGGDNKSEFMLVAMAIVAITMLICMLANRKKGLYLKRSFLFGGACGLINASMNLLSILAIVAVKNVSMIYPLSSSLKLILSAVASYVFFKERPDRLRLAGLILGAVAVVFLNF